MSPVASSGLSHPHQLRSFVSWIHSLCSIWRLQSQNTNLLVVPLIWMSVDPWRCTAEGVLNAGNWDWQFQGAERSPDPRTRTVLSRRSTCTSWPVFTSPTRTGLILQLHEQRRHYHATYFLFASFLKSQNREHRARHPAYCHQPPLTIRFEERSETQLTFWCPFYIILVTSRPKHRVWRGAESWLISATTHGPCSIHMTQITHTVSVSQRLQPNQTLLLWEILFFLTANAHVSTTVHLITLSNKTVSVGSSLG